MHDQIQRERITARQVVTNPDKHTPLYAKLCWRFLREHGAKDGESKRVTSTEVIAAIKDVSKGEKTAIYLAGMAIGENRANNPAMAEAIDAAFDLATRIADRVEGQGPFYAEPVTVQFVMNSVIQTAVQCAAVGARQVQPNPLNIKPLAS